MDPYVFAFDPRTNANDSTRGIFENRKFIFQSFEPSTFLNNIDNPSSNLFPDVTNTFQIPGGKNITVELQEPVDCLDNGIMADDSIRNEKIRTVGTGPTNYQELSSFLYNFDETKTPPFLIYNHNNGKDDIKWCPFPSQQFHKGIRSQYMFANDFIYLLGTPTFIPKDYISIGDIFIPQHYWQEKRSAIIPGTRDMPMGEPYKVLYNYSNIRTLYAHKSICYTKAPLILDAVMNSNKLYVPDYRGMDTETASMYIHCGYFLDDTRGSVMVLKSFFKRYPSGIQRFVRRAEYKNIGGIEFTTDGRNRMTPNATVNEPDYVTGYAFRITNINNAFEMPITNRNINNEVAANSGFQWQIVRDADDESPSNWSIANPDFANDRYDLINKGSLALKQMLTIITEYGTNLNTLYWMGLSDKYGNLNHQYIRPFVTTLCHPLPRNPSYPDPVYVLADFPRLCNCIGKDGSAYLFNDKYMDYKPPNAPFIRQRCANKDCLESTRGVYRLYDATCKSSLLCTDSSTIERAVSTVNSGIVFNSNDLLCKQEAVDVTAIPKSLDVNIQDLFAITNARYNDVMFDNVSTELNKYYIPIKPTTPTNDYVKPLQFKLYDVQNVATDTVAGEGPTTWAEIGPTLFNLHKNNIPPFLIQKSIGAVGYFTFLGWRVYNITSTPENYLPVGDLITGFVNPVLFAHKSICYTNNVTVLRKNYTNSVPFGEANLSNFSGDVPNMYTPLGYYYRDNVPYPVSVLKVFLTFTKDRGYTNELFAGCYRRVFIEEAEAAGRTFWFNNTSFFNGYEVNNAAHGYELIPSAMQALQHVARLATSVASNIDDAIWQGFADKRTELPIHNVFKLILAGNGSVFGQSGICHPRNFLPEEIASAFPYIDGFTKICACFGTDGAEDAMNALLLPYMSSGTQRRLELRCTSQACNDVANTKVYRWEKTCPDVQLCIQDVVVRNRVKDVVGDSIKFSNISQTCNFNVSTNPPPTDLTDLDIRTGPTGSYYGGTERPTGATGAVGPTDGTGLGDATGSGDVAGSTKSSVYINMDAIIGVTVGAIVICIIIGVLLYYAFLYKRRTANQNNFG